MIKKTPLKYRSRFVSNARQQFSRSLLPLSTTIDAGWSVTVESLPLFQEELHRQKQLLRHTRKDEPRGQAIEQRAGKSLSKG